MLLSYLIRCAPSVLYCMAANVTACSKNSRINRTELISFNDLACLLSEISGETEPL